LTRKGDLGGSGVEFLPLILPIHLIVTFLDFSGFPEAEQSRFWWHNNSGIHTSIFHVNLELSSKFIQAENKLKDSPVL
jgi:hypothetical protein